MDVTRAAQNFKVPAVMIFSQERVKLQSTDFKFRRYIHRVYPNKSPLKILEKRECGRIQGLPNERFWVAPIISGTGKAANFKFDLNIHSVYPNKSPLKILEKREPGRIKRLPKFLGTHYYLRNR